MPSTCTNGMVWKLSMTYCQPLLAMRLFSRTVSARSIGENTVALESVETVSSGMAASSSRSCWETRVAVPDVIPFACADFTCFFLRGIGTRFWQPNLLADTDSTQRRVWPCVLRSLRARRCETRAKTPCSRLLRQCQTDIRAREEYRQPSRAHALYAPPPDPTGPYPSRGVRGYPKRARIVLPRSSVGLGSGRRLGLGKYTSDAEHVALLRALYRAPLMRGWSTQLGRRPPARKLGRIALFQWHSADSPPPQSHLGVPFETWWGSFGS